MVGMEIIETQDSWNALPVNSYAVLTSRHEGRTETLFISRCSEDRGTMSGNHMIAGGKHWADQFAGAETAAVLYRAADTAGGAPSVTRILNLPLVQAAAAYAEPDEVRGYVASAHIKDRHLPDRVALWLAVIMSSTGDFPALTSLHTTGEANTESLRCELARIRTRDTLRMSADNAAAKSAADRVAAMLVWLDAR